MRESVSVAEVATTTPLDDWLAMRDPDETLTTAEIIAEGLKLGIAKRTSEAWMESRCDDDPESLGTLHRIRKGLYQPRRMA